MIESCAACRFFRETVDKHTPGSTGACVRYPKELKPISRAYWCGEFKKP